MCGRRFLLLSVLLLLLSSLHLSAEVCLTDAEFQELTTIFENWDNRINERETLIANLETQLATATEQQENLQSLIEMKDQTLNELNISFDALKREQTIKVVKTAVVASLISAIAGLIGGLLLGLSL